MKRAHKRANLLPGPTKRLDVFVVVGDAHLHADVGVREAIGRDAKKLHAKQKKTV